MSSALAQLIDQGRLWRGHVPRTVHTLPTGHAALDAVLPGGGWPRGALSEVVHAAPGSGELRLVLPLLARLTQQGRPVVLVAPPLLPYAPGWAQAGVDLSRLIVIEAPAPQALDTTCQLLQAGAAAVCLWVVRLNEIDTRRLTLAAETAQAFALWMRHTAAHGAPSTAALRLRVDGNGAAVLKVRGGRPHARCLLAA